MEFTILGKETKVKSRDSIRRLTPLGAPDDKTPMRAGQAVLVGVRNLQSSISPILKDAFAEITALVFLGERRMGFLGSAVRAARRMGGVGAVTLRCGGA